MTAYGLAVEHTLGDLTQWSGEAGETYFYQSELPYDVTQQNFGAPGYVGYRVNSTVTSHKAWVPKHLAPLPVITHPFRNCQPWPIVTRVHLARPRSVAT